MAKTVVGLFDDFSTAQRVVDELVKDGFPREDISLVANDVNSEYSQYLSRSSETRAANLADEDAVSAGDGAGFGALVGALTGVMVGVGAFIIPGIGPVLAAGPLLAGLTGGAIGAVAGAATGGMVGALVKTGLTEEEAQYYAEGVRRGGTLVVVNSPDDMSNRARELMHRHSVVDIGERVSTWRQSGWTRFDESTSKLDKPIDDTVGPHETSSPTTSRAAQAGAAGEPLGTTAGRSGANVETGTEGRYVGSKAADESLIERQEVNIASSAVASASTPGAANFNAYDSDFRTHYETTYPGGAYSYDQYAPVYRYGYDLAHDPRYRDSDWDTVERDARRRWEEINPNNPWDNFKEAVRHAWERARGLR